MSAAFRMRYGSRMEVRTYAEILIFDPHLVGESEL